MGITLRASLSLTTGARSHWRNEKQGGQNVPTPRNRTKNSSATPEPDMVDAPDTSDGQDAPDDVQDESQEEVIAPPVTITDPDTDALQDPAAGSDADADDSDDEPASDADADADEVAVTTNRRPTRRRRRG